VTCASPDYFSRRGIPRAPGDIEGQHDLLGYFSSLTGRAFPLIFERGGERLEISSRATVAVNESTAHLTALCAGLGLGQTFRFMAAPHLATGALKAVLTEWSRPRHKLHIIYPPSRHLNARLRVFVDWTVLRFAPI
jgi:DNA-binding transcriptional LysR family regulator